MSEKSEAEQRLQERREKDRAAEREKRLAETEKQNKIFHPAYPNGQVEKEYIMFDRAWNLAKKLKSKYSEFNIKVDVVKKDDELFSDENLKLGVTQHTYFVSTENPDSTAKFTDALIRYDAHKETFLADKARQEKKAFLEKAHEIRSESSAQTLQDLVPDVSRIISELQTASGGKKPSLRKIAAALNAENIPSPGGKPKWFAPAVTRVIEASKTGHQK